MIPENGSNFRQGRAFTGPLRPAGMRHINAREVYWLLRANSPCSRADLVRLSGLSAPTVSVTVDHLEKRGLITSIGLGESAGGRPPGLLSLNPDCAYIAGFEITSTTIRIALADLEGKRVGDWSARLNSKETPVEVVAGLRVGLEKILLDHSIPREKLYSVCASVPGITDFNTGKVVSAPHIHGWKDVPLRRLLEDALEVIAVVENDVNLSVLGERTKGAAKGQENFVFLWVGNGVGAGIFIDGKLRRGAIGGAGEIGYMRVPGAPQGELSIHATGSLEDAVGQIGIEEAWLRKHAPAEINRVSAAEILSMAAAGDVVAVEIRDTTAAILSQVIVNISVLLDPSMIVLGGEIGSSPELFAAVRNEVKRNEFVSFRLVASHLGKDAALMGAEKLALETAETGLLSFIE